MIPLRRRSSCPLLALAMFLPASSSLGVQPFGASFPDLQGDKTVVVSDAKGPVDSAADIDQALKPQDARAANGGPVQEPEEMLRTPNSEPVDPALVGTWELGFPDTQDAWKWVLQIEANGHYSLTTEGSGQIAGHSGKFQGAGGRWSLRSTQGMAWTDGGTYSFPEGPDGKTLLLEGGSDPGVWTRR